MSGVFERLQSSLGRNLVGQDIFICYSRRDAGAYAARLEDRLAESGYAVFVDRLGTYSRDLPAGIRRALSNSSMMVVLATDGAGDSKYIAYEIEEFRKNRGSNSIIVVDFDGSLRRARWFNLVEGLAPAAESMEALRTGDPSDSVVYQIDRSFSYRKSKDRLRRYRNRALSVLAILLVLVVATAMFATSSMRRAQQAVRQLDELNMELANRKARVDELIKQQAAREAYLAELESRLKLVETSFPKSRQEIEKQIDELHSQLAANEAQVKTLNGQVAEKNAQIAELTSQLNKEKESVAVLTEASKRPTPEPSPSKTPKEETPWSLMAGLSVLGIVLAYSGACAILLRTKPLWILRLYEQISLDKIIDATDSSMYAKLAKLMVGAVGIDYFAKHARTREAWVVSYRLGNSQIGKLPATIKAEYIKHDDVLDAWAEVHRAKAGEALERSRILKGSQYVVPLRIKVGEDATPKVLRGWKEFGYLFENEERTLVQIVGKGGSGKTTLAGELARAAIDQNPDYA